MITLQMHMQGQPEHYTNFVDMIDPAKDDDATTKLTSLNW